MSLDAVLSACAAEHDMCSKADIISHRRRLRLGHLSAILSTGVVLISVSRSSLAVMQLINGRPHLTVVTIRPPGFYASKAQHIAYDIFVLLNGAWES